MDLRAVIRLGNCSAVRCIWSRQFWGALTSPTDLPSICSGNGNARKFCFCISACFLGNAMGGRRWEIEKDACLLLRQNWSYEMTSSVLLTWSSKSQKKIFSLTSYWVCGPTWTEMTQYSARDVVEEVAGNSIGAACIRTKGEALLSNEEIETVPPALS